MIEHFLNKKLPIQFFLDIKYKNLKKRAFYEKANANIEKWTSIVANLTNWTCISVMTGNLVYSSTILFLEGELENDDYMKLYFPSW